MGALSGPNGPCKRGRANMSDLVEEASAPTGEDIPTEMPLPSDPRTIFLGGLFALAVVTAAYVASEIVFPLVFAFILKLLLQPLFRAMERLRIPRAVAALLIILALLGTIVGIVTVISGPASDWAGKLPDGIPRLEQRLSFLRPPINALQNFMQQTGVLSGGESKSDAGVKFSGSRFARQRVRGDAKLRQRSVYDSAFSVFSARLGGYVSAPSRRDFAQVQRQAPGGRHFAAHRKRHVSLSDDDNADERRRGRRHCGGHVSDWSWRSHLVGTLAFLLNYAPILGPSIGLVVFLLAGLLSMDTLWRSLIPSALYLAIHLIEGETLTPLLLARRFTLNPVLIILSLVFWFWMWGIPGAILAVPMLAITKIVCDRVRPLAAFAHFLEG